LPKKAYIERRFSKKTTHIITLANEIITEYQAQGFDLTLRQLYYQLVARDYIPNKQAEYKKLSVTIKNARLAGLVDWVAIVDRTRELRTSPHWSSPKEVIKSAELGYSIDKWEGQPYRPEVWIEKDALTGVIAPICEQLDVPYFACRGYNSLSEMWRASNRFSNNLKVGQVPFIIHLGDHDPSGLDMTNDIIKRSELLTGRDDFTVKRIALNYDQVEQYNPPPNPAKFSDPRASDYIGKFGRSSWELDALDPVTISNLIETEILAIRDNEKWEAAKVVEAEGRLILKSLYDSLD